LGPKRMRMETGEDSLKVVREIEFRRPRWAYHVARIEEVRRT
jgi:hypothetical protein